MLELVPGSLYAVGAFVLALWLGDVQVAFLCLLASGTSWLSFAPIKSIRNVAWPLALLLWIVVGLLLAWKVF